MDEPETTVRWRFDDADAPFGWELPEQLQPLLLGGALWVRPWRDAPRDAAFVVAFPRLDKAPCLGSPAGLGLGRERAAKVHLRLRNCSPETDCRVWVATQDAPDERIGPIDVPMRPYDTGWQELFGHLDDLAWDGELDRLWLQFPNGQAGDVFIAEIGLGPGSPRVRPVKPDVLGELPKLSLPGITQDQFEDAFAILDEAVMYDHLPVNGFPTPFLAPGAAGAFYGKNWWVLDASLAMHPLLWTAPEFCIRMMEGFADIQDANPDGCIQHEGKICRRGLPCDLSVIPRVFEAWDAVCRISDDGALRRRLYDAMARHLDWWLSPVKRDAATGLVTGFMEESFTYHGGYGPGEMAAVDTNVAVAVGAHLCGKLAEELGLPDEAASHRQLFNEIAAAINRWLWDEEQGCYLNWMVKESARRSILANHMFDTLRLGIAPRERRERLFERLFDPEQFGWGKLGLTTVARQDPKFVVATGPYNGTAWNGDIWTMRSHPVIQGLRECGERARAAELALHTVKIFAGQYAEYLEPDGGTPHGVARYSWTAGQWLQMIIEEIFGLCWHAVSRTLSVDPMVSAALAGEDLSLTGLRLPDTLRTRFDLRLRRGPDGNTDAELTADTVPEGYQLGLPDGPRKWTSSAVTWRGQTGCTR